MPLKLHDVKPVLLAFLTILVTTINFFLSNRGPFHPNISSIMVFSNEKGTFIDIKEAEVEMITVGDSRTSAWLGSNCS